MAKQLVRERPRTIALLGVLYVLGGACATLLVAWACSWQGKPASFDDLAMTATWMDADGRVYRYELWNKRRGAQHARVASFGKEAPDEFAHAITSSTAPLPASMTAGLVGIGWRDLLSCGWPMSAVWGGYDWPPMMQKRPGAVQESPIGTVSIGVSKNRDRGMHGALPVMPLFPGFIVDTAMYGLAFLACHGLLRKCRQLWRGTRGNCARCGYPHSDLPAGSPCPECGTARRK
ncbi:MAG TPA: hypothetical protein PKE29_03375 [Phycisphaerales bacterium]|nr:hypothetical protein [Phycisphaerales bacterium]